MSLSIDTAGFTSFPFLSTTKLGGSGGQRVVESQGVGWRRRAFPGITYHAGIVEVLLFSASHWSEQVAMAAFLILASRLLRSGLSDTPGPFWVIQKT